MVSSKGAISRNAYYSNKENKYQQAIQDFLSSVRSYELWGLLGYLDIKQRYRRSVIGPFWLTISMGVTVAALGFLYAHLFNLELSSYLPFLALGFIIWQFISGVITESADIFMSSESMLKQNDSLFFLQIFRLVWRNLIILAHNMLIYLCVLFIFDVPLGLGTFYFVPALLVVISIALGVGLLLGLICTRFRDIGPLVQNITQLFFFMTPIIWKPELLRNRTEFLDFNPFYHVVTILRAPLLGETAGALSWAVSIGLAGCGLLLAFMMLSAVRRHIAYWL